MRLLPLMHHTAIATAAPCCTGAAATAAPCCTGAPAATAAPCCTGALYTEAVPKGVFLFASMYPGPLPI